jgi:predicted outer membrane lipoprotein
VLDRLGVGYERLREENPGLVYCAITGYGQDGPYTGRSGHDMNYLGLIGLLGLTGEPDGRPIQSAGQIADLGGGALMAAFGILAALLIDAFDDTKVDLEAWLRDPPGQIPTLLITRLGAAHVDVVQRCRIEALESAEGSVNHTRSKIIRPDRDQRTFSSPADGRPRRRNDHRLSHRTSPC